MQNEDAQEDLKKLIKAVIDYSVTSYVKLQHPLNRKTKSQKQDYLRTLQIFYDPEYSFEHFVHEDSNEPMTTSEMISFLLDGASVSMKNTKEHIQSEAYTYWLDKNFHDIKLPQTFSIAGKVWLLKNSPNNVFIDHDNLRLYFPLRKKGADRIFFNLVLKIILTDLSIELTSEQFEDLSKTIYLLFKINGYFIEGT